MRHSAWLLFAVLSAHAGLCGAATRPRYGGTLRVEMRAAATQLEPGAPIASLVFEPLVRIDSSGAPQPCLAVSWQHDASAKRWQLDLRPGVKFHDGFLLVPGAVVASLEEALPGRSVSAAADTVIVRADRPQPGLLYELAHNAPIFAHNAEGALVGTGPFRAAAWEPGRQAVFTANEDYWGGRPFLDRIEVRMGRSLRDQLVDLEVNRADFVELGPAEVRRATERGLITWSTAPLGLAGLVFAPGRGEDPRLRQALALSIDRAAMHSVLLQKQGEISAALLPEWLSGYAFAFSAAPDLVRARELANGLPTQARALALSYDPGMPAARPLAERVAVNARDAGLAIQVAPQNSQADVRLALVDVPSLDAGRALAGLAAALGLEAPAIAGTSAALYEAERKLLETFRVIPLFYLPAFYGASARVHASEPPLERLGEWQFENIWLAGSAP